jgi:hypothetical protein
VVIVEKIRITQEGPNHSTGAVHIPNDRNYGWLGQPTGANDGVARLTTQSTPLLTRRDLVIFGRDWDREENSQDKHGRATRENEENDGGGKQPAFGNRTPRRSVRPYPLQTLQPGANSTAADPEIPILRETASTPVYVPRFRGTQLIANGEAPSYSDKKTVTAVVITSKRLICNWAASPIYFRVV